MSPLVLFAQNDDVAAAGLLATFFGLLCAVGLVALLPAIFFLLTQQKALSRCSPRNRTMDPGMVWLALVPFVGLGWIFLNVIRIAESLRNEFRSRGRHRRDEDYGQGIGIAYCSLLLAAVIPYCGMLFALGWLVCWIVYWVKIANLSGQIERPYTGGDRYDEDDDYEDDEDDDRPRRRRRDDDDDEDDDRPQRRRDDDDERDDRKPWERNRR